MHNIYSGAITVVVLANKATYFLLCQMLNKHNLI